MGTSGSDLEIGTDQWLVRTGGRLTLMQALKIAAQGFHQTMQSRLSRKSQHGESQASEQLGRVNKARDHLTPVLQVLRDRVIDRQGQAMLNHSCRTYLLGAALLSDEEFRRIDFTLAAVAALAHDDGLVNPSTHGNCFTADSASEANFLLEKLGMPEKSFEPARAAVIAHFQPVLT